MPAMTDVTVDLSQEQREAVVTEELPWMAAQASSIGGTVPSNSLAMADLSGAGDFQQTVHRASPTSFIELEPSMTFAISYSDVKDPKAIQGVAGLRNLGNTCFMNSGLQCLFCIPRLVKFFLSDFPLDVATRETLTGQFAELLKKMWSGEYAVIHPSKFKEVIGMYHPHFSDYRQHDCQELLALLLDSLHEQLNKALAQHHSRDTESSSPTDTMMSSSLPVENQSDTSSEQELNNASQSAQVEFELNNARTEASSATTSGHSEADPLNQSQCATSSTIPPSQSKALEQEMPEVVQSEDSNQSATSLQSTDLVQSEMPPQRLEGIPESVKPFSCPVIPPSVDVSGEVPMDAEEEEKEAAAAAEAAEKQEDCSRCKLPSLEDLYMKDTKTLNTNVLATEYMDEDIATDSDKFHKPDNLTRSPQQQAELFENFEQLNDLFSYEAVKNVPLKPVKETNLLANMKEKFSGDCYSEKCLFSEMVGAAAYVSLSGDGVQKKLLYSQLDADDASCSINNIKRIKIDEDEKNLRMAAQLKVNTDKKPTNIRSNLVLKSRQLSDQACALVADGDQSLSQSGTSYPREHAAIPLLPNQLREKDLREAERAWKKYVRYNKSVIVDTFQGQFRSTVVCSECQHVSVTYEPFMYLSVPLPHAMERQISVLFVPCDNKQPVKYLLTLNKQDRVNKLKVMLTQRIGEETCDLIMAEVFDNHISRILEDNTMLRYVNDSTRMVYAIEMLPPPQLEDLNAETDDITTGTNNVTSTTDVPPNNMMSAASKPNSDSQSQDVFSNIGSFPAADGWQNLEKLNKDRDVSSVGRLLDFETNILNNLSTNQTGRWGFPAVDFQENVLSSSVPDSTVRDISEVDTGVQLWEKSSGVASTSGNWDLPSEPKNGTQTGDAASGNAQSNDTYTQNDDAYTQNDDAEVKTDQWRSCAICLEEMADCDLMVHTICDGTLCQSCLEMSFKHYGDAAFTCPVCSSPVTPLEDFIQLDCMANYKPKTRILSVPVVHRLDGGKGKMRLFGHPNILYLPSKMTGEFLYESVDRVVSCLSNYVIILTDGQGYHCSRCLYTEHCSGCQLAREAVEVQLQPGDNLAVHFTDLTQEQMESAHNFTDHKSMADLRSDEPLTLLDCFSAFTESERLDEHNPWFCPSCKKNQCANKTMTVWRYPETLVVYLKRFVFHDLVSTKIDSKVVFPLENMDLSDCISGPEVDDLVYDLQACVCHFGGASAGHYTAYAKHPVVQDWYYYNDETKTQQKPQEADFNNGYVLFYQRQGTKINFDLPKKLAVCDPKTGSQQESSTPLQCGSTPLHSTGQSTQETLAARSTPPQPDSTTDPENPKVESQNSDPEASSLDFYQ